MPVRQEISDNSRKRPRLEANVSKPSQIYTNASQIRNALRSENPDALTEALTSLRSQLALKPHETPVPPQDERLSLVKQWMDASSGAQELFVVWENAGPRQSSLIALVLSCLSSILALLSSHYTDHALGQPVMKSLLNPMRLRQFNSYIGGSHNELIIVTLKLYYVMSDFASGRDRKAVLEGFGWEIKSLPRLLHMRRKTNGAQDRTDPLLRPDIRTLYILFLLSFLSPSTPAQTKTLFLEQHRDAFLSIFKGLQQDHYSLARRVLEVSWGLWADNKVRRTLKVGVFNEITIGHLVKLYERAQPEDEDKEHVPANLVHHFLLAICTRPGVGICFKDRGWYPREANLDEVGVKDDEDDEGRKRPGRVYNKILANVLKTLKVNEDARQQELALKILEGSPELVAGYWSCAALTLEPRLSSKWITNIAFFGNVIFLPVPSSSFLLPSSSSSNLYNPTPPPLHSILENVLPSVGTKNNFSKGLQSPCKLVQHSTALALARCLLKYEEVREAWDHVRKALGEDDSILGSEGLWTRRWKEVEREVRKRVPDVQVLVAFQICAQQGSKDAKDANLNETQKALLMESAQRLLWLYHRCLPALVVEARFEIGRLLGTFTTTNKDHQLEGEEEIEETSPARLHRIQQLHVLRLLRDSEQFTWSGKIASLPNTPIYILFSALCSMHTPAIRWSLADVLIHVLSQSILFQEDPNEPELWLRALPRCYPGRELDEVDAVIAFLDECIQRCLKTPYRYIEALHSLASQNSEIAETTSPGCLNRLDTYPSPLLMAIIEQLEAKVKTKSLSSSNVLAVVTFVRKLVFYLASKTPDLGLLKVFVGRLEGGLGDSKGEVGVKREMVVLRASLDFGSGDGDVDMEVDGQEVEQWLEKTEKMATPNTKAARTAAALQTLDWLRGFAHLLGTGHLKRLVSLVTSLDPEVLPLLVETFIPGQTNLWSAPDIMATFSELRKHLQVGWLYVHTGPKQIVDEKCWTLLYDVSVSRSPSIGDLNGVIHLVMHGITASRDDNSAVAGHLALLGRILEAASTTLSIADFSGLKDSVFLQPSVFKEVFTVPSSQGVMQAISSLLKTAIDPMSSDDRKVVADISNHWLNVLKVGLDGQSQCSVSTACTWIKYLEPFQLFDLLDFLHEDNRSASVLEPANAVLEALSSLATSDWRAESTLVHRLPQLVSLRTLLTDSSLLEDLIATALEASLPMGLDGFLPYVNVPSFPPAIAPNLAAMVKGSKTRWTRRRQATKIDLDIRQFLTQKTFSSATVKIISGLLYCRPASREMFVQWVASADCLRRDIRDLLPILHAFLESGSLEHTTKYEVWAPLLPRVVHTIWEQGNFPELRMKAQQCLFDIVTALDSEHDKVLSTLAAELKTFSKANVSPEMLSTGIWLANYFGLKAKSSLTTIVDSGIQWAIDTLAEDNYAEESNEVIQWLALLVTTADVPKPHLVETLLSVIIQNHLSNILALHLAVKCLSSSQLKPVIVNKYLQSTIQHPHFFRINAGTSPEALKGRKAVAELLHCLFNLHPTNTCQITHVEPIIKIYRGTLSSADLRILSIFQLFETQRKFSVTPLLSRWSATPGISSQTALEAIQSLDPILVLRTSLQFPKWRRVDDQANVRPSSGDQDSTLYDPVFLILLFSQMLSEQPPSSAFAWVEVFRTNVVSLFIRALSAKDGRVRELALCQIIALWKHLETADLHEKPHVLYILNLLKDLMPPPYTSPESSEPHYPRRLPTYASLLLMHALRGVFYPSNSIYPLTARFLLQRPTLDTSDVPMLYGMLYSSSDDNWKKERMWMIKSLADGMVGSEDWKVLKRRHTWDLLASLFQSAEGDAHLRSGILEVLANLTCNAQATTSLILRSALLPWIEMQLLNSAVGPNAEGVEWIKILENILVIVDSNKIETATNGEWLVVICRCLLYLLDERRCSSVSDNFPHTVPVILRLASLGALKSHYFPSLLDVAVTCLETIENVVQLTSHPPLALSLEEGREAYIPSPPHSSSNLHRRVVVDNNNSLLLWGHLVESLWHATMYLDSNWPAWDALTPRMLIWSSVSGVQVSRKVGVAQWARKEVVRALLGVVPS